MGYCSDGSAPDSLGQCADGTYAGETGSVNLSGTPVGGGTSLNELGTFFGQIGTAVTSVFHAVNTPQPVVMPKSTLPMSSFSQTLGGSSGSLLLVALIVFGGIFALRAVRK